LRSAGKALISALCEPFELIDKAELDGDFTLRLALIDEFRNLPINAVWNYLCYKNNKPIGTEWIEQLKKYENEVQKARV